ASLINLLGDLIILIALVPEALYYVITKAIPLNISPLIGSMMINIINALIILPLMFFIHYEFIPLLSLWQWCVLFILGITSGLFYLFWSKGCLHIEASTAGMMTALMPIFTLIMSWIFLSEGISFIQFIGMLFIIFSIFVGHYKTP